MIKEALQYLISLGNVESMYEDGQTYSTRPVHLLKEPVASALTVHTLAGLVDYLRSEYDKQDGADNVIVQVYSPTEVRVFGQLNGNMNRDNFITAEALLPHFNFGSWHNVEAFNIALQSTFLNAGDRAAMLQIVGNIKEENVATIGDDGTSQQVRAKTGVATVADVRVPNPVSLCPFRTFVELKQPESNFVFRMRTGPECALFEADGGAWKVEAMDNIRDYLADALASQITAKKVVLVS